MNEKERKKKKHHRRGISHDRSHGSHSESFWLKHDRIGTDKTTGINVILEMRVKKKRISNQDQKKDKKDPPIEKESSTFITDLGRIAPPTPESRNRRALASQ